MQRSAPKPPSSSRAAPWRTWLRPVFLCLLPALVLSPASMAQVERQRPSRVVAPSGATPAVDFAATGMSLHAGRYLNAVAVADLDGDGWPDIVTGNGMSFGFSVLLGDGAGGFLPAVDHPVGEPVATRVALAVADVDGDGRPDVVAAGTTMGSAWLYRGDGSGGFAAPVTVPIGNDHFPHAVALADVDGDGDLDLVTATDGGAAASAVVLLGDGAGGFSPGGAFEIGPFPEGLAVGDANGDGHADIVTSSREDNALSILHGDGAGGFAAQAALPFPGDTAPFGVAIADIDGDGHADLVTANAGSDGTPFPPPEVPGSVSILRGDGSGGFVGAERLELGAGTIGRAHAVVVADATADGRLDIVVSHPVGNATSVFPGDGGGGFDAPLRRPAGVGAGALAVADATGDGHLDVVTGNGENASVLPGDGVGGIGFAGNFDAGRFPHAVASLDLDGDGHPDVLVANANDGTVSVLRNDGTGTLVAAGTHAVGASPTSLVTGDMNGDGHVDAVVANLGGGTVSVLLGDGSAGFAATADFDVGEGFQSPYAVAVGDANGDGHLDVATANTNIESESISVLLGDGAGGLGTPVMHAVASEPYSSPQGVLLADVTGDGNADIVTANLSASSLSLLAGDGAGGFARAQPLSAGTGPVMVLAGDVDGDGRADLVSLDHGGQSVSVLVAIAGGGFGPARTFPIYPPQSNFLFDPWPWGIALGDVDGDGMPDIVTANTQNDTVSVLVNDGSGHFPTFLNVGTGAQPGAIAIADIDDDGRADLVTANRGNDNASVLLQRGGGFADLAVAVTATPANVGPGETMTFDATLDNLGPDEAGFPGIGFALGAEAADLAVDAPAGWSCDAPEVGNGSTSIACVGGALAPGTAVGFSATAAAPALAEGDIVAMTVAATSQAPDPAPGNNSASTAVSVQAEADLAISVTGPDEVVRSTTSTFAVPVANHGPAGAAQAAVSLSADVPAAAVGTVAPEGWQCVRQASRLYRETCSPLTGAMAADAEATFEVSVAIGGRLFPPRFSLRTSATSASDDPAPGDNTAALVVRMVRAP